MTDQANDLNTIVSSLGLSGIRKHIFLCADQTKPKCCQKEVGLEAWDYLKRRIKELKLEGHIGLFRTKANCLQVCTQGPIAVVYPDGIWYRSCSPEVLEQIIQKHLLAGQCVDDYVIARSKLEPSA